MLGAVSTRAWTLTLMSAIACAPVTPMTSGPAAPAEPATDARSGGQWNSTANYELAKYDDVPFGTHERSACSPPVPEDVAWRGVVIQARSHVAFVPSRPAASGRFAVVPVCGYSMIDLPKLMDGQAMQLIFTDTATKQVFRGPVLEVDDNPQEPPPERAPIDPATPANMATGGYFNLDATQYVALPMRAATYKVVVEYGGSRSNAVTVVVSAGE